jgi:hypothetical protein
MMEKWNDEMTDSKQAFSLKYPEIPTFQRSNLPVF